MEELKIVMEALAKMSEGASTAFLFWCAKEMFGYLMIPTTFSIIGVIIYKIVVFINTPQKD